MSQSTIIHTGVLIAFLLPKDKFHHWAVAQLSQISPPLITCEAVLTEACFLAQRINQGQATILRLFQREYTKFLLKSPQKSMPLKA